MNDLQIPKLLFVITRFYVVLGMFEDFEFEDKFNPWTVKSLDDFLFYCCPECDHKTKTKSLFIDQDIGVDGNKNAINKHGFVTQQKFGGLTDVWIHLS